MLSKQNCVLYCFYRNGFTTRSIQSWNNNLISMLYQHWNHNLISTKFQPHIIVVSMLKPNRNVVSTLKSQRQYNFQIQPYFNHVSTLMCDRCINVDTMLLCLLGWQCTCPVVHLYCFYLPGLLYWTSREGQCITFT